MEEKNKIYVGNLEFGITDDELKKFAEEKGLKPRSVTVIKDKYTNRSKGFGFAEFGSDEEVRQAIEALNGQDLKGRKLRVNMAMRQADKPEGSGRPDRPEGRGYNNRM